jgi:NAD-dependent deacetylase
VNKQDKNIEKAAGLILQAKRVTAFTGAGISVESGIPPFRGENGLWSRFNPEFLDIHFFNTYPEKSWKLIKEIFYDYFGKANPNAAHIALANLEKEELLHAIITQNIDNLHQIAGSKNVYEFHGNSRDLVCTRCQKDVSASLINMETLPPQCPDCKGILKPDFVFFGEPIPETANANSFAETQKSDVFLLIGTTGEIMPASIIPHQAANQGAAIIEINIEPSNYTKTITRVFIQSKATDAMQRLADTLLKK